MRAYVSRTDSGPKRMLRITSAPAAASPGSVATLPTPTARARSAVRFQRVSSWPAVWRRRAIAAPIFPVPNNATLMALPDRHQRLIRLHDLTLLDLDLRHLTRLRADDVVLHLHRLQHRHHVTQLDLVTDLHRQLHDQSLHGRYDGPVFGGPRCRRRGGLRLAAACRGGADRHPGAADPHLEDLALDLHLELGSLRRRGRRLSRRRWLRVGLGGRRLGTRFPAGF